MRQRSREQQVCSSMSRQQKARSAASECSRQSYSGSEECCTVQHDAVPVRYRLHSHSFSNCGRQTFSTVARHCSQSVISTSPVPPAVPFRAGGAVSLCWCRIHPLARKASPKPENSKCRTLLILVWAGFFHFTTPDRAVSIPYTEPGLARRWRIYHEEH